ncbi:hypothetical protein KR074_005831 [Drosophila pseudoananassae]|nr:hypothetical protein KR074_005831 [Drosophila pseudoananassae]
MATSSSVMETVAILALLLGLFIRSGYCIDCFKCVSYNGANKACDDPFHNNYSTAILESPCMGGRKGRDGLFPATACIKIAGYYGKCSNQLMNEQVPNLLPFHLSTFPPADETGETITVRGCALDSGTLTTDTEIIRMSHCGKFYYDDKYVHGCLQSCSDADACNSAKRHGHHAADLESLMRHLLSLTVLFLAVAR